MLKRTMWRAVAVVLLLLYVILVPVAVVAAIVSDLVDDPAGVFSVLRETMITGER